MRFSSSDLDLAYEAGEYLITFKEALCASDEAYQEICYTLYHADDMVFFIPFVAKLRADLRNFLYTAEDGSLDESKVLALCDAYQDEIDDAHYATLTSTLVAVEKFKRLLEAFKPLEGFFVGPLENLDRASIFIAFLGHNPKIMRMINVDMRLANTNIRQIWCAGIDTLAKFFATLTDEHISKLYSMTVAIERLNKIFARYVAPATAVTTTTHKRKMEYPKITITAPEATEQSQKLDASLQEKGITPSQSPDALFAQPAAKRRRIAPEAAPDTFNPAFNSNK